MSAFLAGVVAFPTVIFTVLLLAFLLYAVAAMLGALELEWLDSLFGSESLDAASDGGFLAGVPVAIVIGVSSVFAWLISFTAMKFLPEALIVKIVVGLVAAGAGLLFGSFAVRPLRPVFVTAEGQHRKQFIGKICTIRSLKVDETSGTADVGDLVAEVRCFRENSLTRGSKAIVYEYDAETGTYHVGPLDSGVSC